MTNSLDYKLHPCSGRQIRLLKLKQDDAAGADNILRYTRHVVSLDESPEYHAISYEWGRQIEVRAIVVDESTLDISSNAEEILRNLSKV
jgi:hypothetical protein